MGLDVPLLRARRREPLGASHPARVARGRRQFRRHSLCGHVEGVDRVLLRGPHQWAERRGVQRLTAGLSRRGRRRLEAPGGARRPAPEAPTRATATRASGLTYKSNINL